MTRNARLHLSVTRVSTERDLAATRRLAPPQLYYHHHCCHNLACHISSPSLTLYTRFVSSILAFIIYSYSDTMARRSGPLRLRALLPLLAVLLLLLSHPTRAGDYPVTISRVSGCNDVGSGTDNCTAGQPITISGTGFLLIPNSSVSLLGVAVWMLPDSYLTLFQSVSNGFNVTNTSIVARLKWPLPQTLSLGLWENITVDGGDFSNLGPYFGPAFRYAAQQPPSIGSTYCSTPGAAQTTHFCNSYSTLIVEGYYLTSVTSAQVSLTLNSGQRVFSVPCSNVTVTLAEPTLPQPYYSLTCQLPQLSYGSLPYSQPTLVLQLSSPYGNVTGNQFWLDATSSAASARLVTPLTLAVLAALLLVMALLYE